MEEINSYEIGLILSSNNLKITPQRVLVYKVMHEMGGHPTAELIFYETKKQMPNLSFTTIYNTLDTFISHNIIKKILTDSGIMRYEINPIHHHHLYCLKTGEVVDYFDNALDELLKKYFKKKKIQDFEINDINLQIVGEIKK